MIGCDQLLVCEGKWFDKPASLPEAREHLRALRGRSHDLVTAIVCHRPVLPELVSPGRSSRACIVGLTNWDTAAPYTR